MSELNLHSVAADGQQNSAPTATFSSFPIVVGRQPNCDFRIDDPLVSRRHCAFSLQDGNIHVEDLGSRNGTRVNGLCVKGVQPLEEGDWLQVGGQVFRVRFPLQEGEAGTKVPGRQVLVVEDDRTTARMLANQLESWGHQVRVAHDGPEALQAAKTQPPEVVLLDIGLPSMSGLEVARRLRDEESLRKARLVAVTGDEGAMEVLKSRQRFEQLLVKPVSSHALREAVCPQV
jgi:CheY-like chemotaxis protein